MAKLAFGGPKSPDRGVGKGGVKKWLGTNRGKSQKYVLNKALIKGNQWLIRLTSHYGATR